jgi:hypothetical protein
VTSDLNKPVHSMGEGELGSGGLLLLLLLLQQLLA